MARKWQNGDSARTMTAKYNETATEVEGLKKSSEQINNLTQKELDKIHEELDKKLDKGVTVKELSVNGTTLVITI